MRTAVAAALFAAIALMIGADLVSDYRAGSETGHLIVELLVMIVAVAGAAVLWGQLRSARRDATGWRRTWPRRSARRSGFVRKPGRRFGASAKRSTTSSPAGR